MFVHQRTFRSSRCVIPGLAAGVAGRAADQVGGPAAAGLRAAGRLAGSGAQARRLTGCGGQLNLYGREIRVFGKGGKPRIVTISFEAARALDRYLRARAGHPLADRAELWLGVNGRGPLTPAGIYQIVVKRGDQAGVAVHPQRFRHHFSHTWLDRGGAGGDLMQLNGWSSPQMLTWYGSSAAGARARRSYDRIMNNPR